MIQFWSYWNFTWFLLAKNNYLENNNLLKCSIISTSIIGAYLVHIYPRKVVIKLNKDYIFKPSYPVMVLGDLLIHQYPMYYLLNNSNFICNNDKCGALVILPIGTWILLNYKLNTKFDRLYGISFYKIALSFGTIVGALGLYKHLLKN